MSSTYQIPFNIYNNLPSQSWPSLVSPDWWLNQIFLLFFKQSKSEWRWNTQVTPLSTTLEVFIGILFYLSFILIGKAILKNRNAIDGGIMVIVHNMFVCLLSLFLLLGFLEQVIPKLMTHGFFWTICNYYSYTQPLELLYYLNYICKWIEFIDTFFLVLKKKKLQTLHVYHHALTMYLCFIQINGKTSISWFVCSVNLFVHVIMYYYYYLASRGIRVSWKKYLTSMQISQFIIDINLVYFCLYTHMAYHNFPSLPNVGDCRGTRQSAYFGCFLLSTYLFLFVQFFIKVYAEGNKISQNKKKNLKATNPASPAKTKKAE
ncbi:hypothetical protein BB561_000110 [Smittium simulii]|uniref:Elongation of fatty acids protein n=1 Tax=Smittium simulii TaxID=133385 RepID=A0A2T9Z0J6_9FUNG|nr:hypothetical protein BB561_000110 [Smittium simulii]